MIEPAGENDHHIGDPPGVRRGAGASLQPSGAPGATGRIAKRQGCRRHLERVADVAGGFLLGSYLFERKTQS